MITAIVQARMGSTRLYGKVAKEISGHPMLWHQLKRIQLCTLINNIVVATTTNVEDQIIVDIAGESGCQSFKGDPYDVLDRYYKTALDQGSSVVVRLTGDCPLVDPKVIDRVIQFYTESPKRYDHVCLDPKWPDGFGVEVFSLNTLEMAWKESGKLYEREHVTPYIYLSGKFNCHRIECEQDLSDLRLTVDEDKDLEVIKGVYENLYPEFGHSFDLDNILDLLRKHPEIFESNSKILRNASFIKAVRSERPVLREDFVYGRDKSNALVREALERMPYQPINPQSILLARGSGSHVWDVDGNEYIDYDMARGSSILGHGYHKVVDAILDQTELGLTEMVSIQLQLECFSSMLAVLGWGEAVFAESSAFKVKMSAMQAAQMATGRDTVVLIGYLSDEVTSIIGELESNSTKYILLSADDDLSHLKSVLEKCQSAVAAVMLRPYQHNGHPVHYLNTLKDLSRMEGFLIIYDEVAHSFRFRLRDSCGIDINEPDLLCLGNYISNGMPFFAIVGPTRIIKHCRDYRRNTHLNQGSNLDLPFAATLATLEELVNKDVPSWIWRMGSRLKNGYEWMVHDLAMDVYTFLSGDPPVMSLGFRANSGQQMVNMDQIFRQEALRRGVIVGDPHFISYSHDEADIDMTLSAYYKSLEIVKQRIHAGNFGS